MIDSLEYDPKLKELAKQIEKLCNENDVACTLLLISPTHSEFLHVLDTSWNVITTMRDGKQFGIRIKSNLLEDFQGDREKQKKATQLTAHVISSILMYSRNTHIIFDNILKEMRKKMTVLYKDWGAPPRVGQ